MALCEESQQFLPAYVIIKPLFKDGLSVNFYLFSDRQPQPSKKKEAIVFF